MARAEHTLDPALWERVGGLWERYVQPYPAAYAQLRYAEALLRQHSRSTLAADALRRAERAAYGLGAQPLLADIADLASEFNIPRSGVSPHVTRQRDDRGDDFLTQ